MVRASQLCVLLLLAGCTSSTLKATSNFPAVGNGSFDGGTSGGGSIDCRDVDAGLGDLGVGTAIGESGFPVMSAQESTTISSLTNDGSDSFALQVDFRLDAKPRTCTGFLPTANPNALEAEGTLYGTLFVAEGSELSPGDYVVGTGANASVGTASVWLDVSTDAGAVQVATSGVVRLTDVEACSFSGVYDVVLGSADGGAGQELSGTFEPIYCP